MQEAISRRSWKPSSGLPARGFESHPHRDLERESNHAQVCKRLKRAVCKTVTHVVNNAGSNPARRTYMQAWQRGLMRLPAKEFVGFSGTKVRILPSALDRYPEVGYTGFRKYQQEEMSMTVRRFAHQSSYGQSGVSMSSYSLYSSCYGSGLFGVTSNRNCQMPDWDDKDGNKRGPGGVFFSCWKRGKESLHHSQLRKSIWLIVPLWWGSLIQWNSGQMGSYLIFAWCVRKMERSVFVWKNEKMSYPVKNNN